MREDVLYLEIVLNETPQPGLLRVIRRGNAFLADASDLRRMGLLPPAGDGSGAVAIDTIPGAALRYEPSTQRLRIDVPLAALSLPTTRLGAMDTRQPVPATTSPGAVLNYDVYASSGNGSQLSLGTDLRVFGIGNAVLENTAITSAHRGGTGSDWQGRSVRLDTSLAWSFPEAATSLVVGDTVTGFLGWSRALRIGGLQFGRNFALQPYRITSPLPTFAGEAVVPSTVELYVDGVRQSGDRVPAGPFQLTSVPGITGAGMAQLVVTDSFGRTRTLDFPFYSTQQLLARGLSDWSASIGLVREDYGLRSFSYGDDLVASAQFRRGVSDRFTAEVHAEAGDGITLAGVGGTWLSGRVGVFGASHARSSEGGSQSGASWHWTDGRFTFSLDSLRTRGDYRDVASLYGPLPPRISERALLGYSHARLGSLSASRVRLAYRAPESSSARLLGLFWTRGFRDWSMHLSWNRDLDRDEHDSVYLGVMVPLGRQRQLSTSWQRSGGSDDVLVDAMQPVPADGGFGWRLQARAGDNRGGVAEAGWLGDRGRLAIGISEFAGDTRGYGQFNGSLVAMAGRAFLARDIHDAFAVVSTDGVAGVPIKRENRIIGYSGNDGLLLVSGLNAWQYNKLSIDPMDLPADLRVTEVDLNATPSDRAGTVVRFSIQPVRAAIVVLHDASGRPLPLGSRVHVDGSVDAQAFVGHGGEAYVESLGARNRLRVDGEDGTCIVHFDYPATATGTIPRIGPVPCRKEEAP
ncbi:MAG: fimbria/pilus outer membrane usher protein [Luteimonas sp.]|nr:fimbria/pilus outer membrane usher protein [Luteimonas sp.]